MTADDRLLMVDLNERNARFIDFPDPLKDRLLTGRGFNVWYLTRYLKPEISALSAGNILAMSCGLLTGTAAPTTSRLHINALSPLTGYLGSSNIGGYVATWLRSCAVVGIVISGCADRPVYLYIDRQYAEIRDAGDLWGRDTFDTQSQIEARHPDAKVKVMSIGPASENGCRFGCIITDQDHAAGRTGMGTVMGAKHLKAIVIAKGDARPHQADSMAAKKASRHYAQQVTASPHFDFFSDYGGAGYTVWADEMGIAATRNYRQARFERMAATDGRLLKSHVTRARGCFRCPVQCKADLDMDGGGKSPRAKRPEFEPMLNLGAKCGLDDLGAIVRLDNLCSRLGIDSTSAATAIGFAMDLFDRGIITVADSDGLVIEWGNARIMEQLIHQMAEGRGFGKILAQGVKRAAAVIGKGAEGYAAHVKGLELTAYHPGAILGTALGCAVSSRGGDYNNVYAALEYNWSANQAIAAFGTADAVDIHAPGGKGRLVRQAILVNIMLDCLGLCKVPALTLLGRFDLELEAGLVSAVTGRPTSAEDLFAMADRIAVLERQFNIDHGLDKHGDNLPGMFMDDPAGELTPAVMEQMVADFYTAMGWDDDGRPSPETLERLDMDDLPAKLPTDRP